MKKHKKLQLTKQTIRNLTESALRGAAGAGWTGESYCYCNASDLTLCDTRCNPCTDPLQTGGGGGGGGDGRPSTMSNIPTACHGGC